MNTFGVLNFFLRITFGVLNFFLRITLGVLNFFLRQLSEGIRA